MMPAEALIEQDNDLFEHFRIEVDPGQSLLRIDKFLMLRIENASRSRIQHAIEAGSVLVNDLEIKSSYKVKPRDIIRVVLPNPPRDKEIIPEDIPLEIVFEDDHLLVVNKPAGMVVHPGYNNYTGTLVHALAWRCKNLPNMDEGRPGLVHRIDKDTSGLLVVAKSELALSHLGKQFYDHSIERKYLALIWGEPKTDEGTIAGFIGRSVRDRRVMDIYDDPEKGKEAITHFRIREKFHYVTLVECELETGRTHQIRAHMQHIGHPLFNDAVYGGDVILKGSRFAKYDHFVEGCFLTIPRQALHAQTLGFKHPATGVPLFFEAPLPIDFKEVLEKWRTYVGANV